MRMRLHAAGRRTALKLGLQTGLAALLGPATLVSRVALAQDPPATPQTIQLVARKFVFTPEQVTVKAGQRLLLVLRTLDFAHGFSLPDLKLRADLVPGQEVTAAQHPHRLDRRGAVEGFGDGCPPVDDERRAGFIVDGEATDVEARAVALVEAAEAERRLTDVERGESALRGLDRHIAFEARLVRAPGTNLRKRLRHPLGRLTHGVEALIDRVDVDLLGRDLGVDVGAIGQRGSNCALLNGGTGQSTGRATAGEEW